MKGEQDIDSYNNEFHDLQLQLYQLSQQEFNGISLFATTTESIGGDEVVFRGNDLEDHSIEVAGNMNNTTISIFKLPFLAALTIKENDGDLPVSTKSVGTGFDSSGNEIPVGQIDSNWTLSGQPQPLGESTEMEHGLQKQLLLEWLVFSSSSPGTYIYATSFDLSGYDISSVNISGTGNQNPFITIYTKLSNGSRVVTSLDDAGLLSVQMKMKSRLQTQSSLARNIASGISFLEMQDSTLNTAQKILVRMSEIKSISAQNPMKSEQDIDSYNNEFHDLQLQLYQLSQQEFNGISLFATTTESIGGDEVVFRGNDLEDHSIEVTGNMNNTTISIFKLPFLAALTIKENDGDLPVSTKSVGTGFDSSGNEIPVGQIDSNWTLSGQEATTPRRVNRNGAWAPETASLDG